MNLCYINTNYYNTGSTTSVTGGSNKVAGITGSNMIQTIYIIQGRLLQSLVVLIRLPVLVVLIRLAVLLVLV